MTRTSFSIALIAALTWMLPASGAEDAAIEAFPAPFLAQPTVTGDWFGARHALEDRGLEIFGSYTAEVWGNTTGGIGTGTVYTGLLNFGATLDLERAVGWQGASVSTTWLWLSGSDLSQKYVGNFLTISNIAGFNTLRMFDLWLQQELLDDKVSIRVGQFSADSEFIISDYAGLFINSTFGWPPFAYSNMPEGGPGYPMGTPGARIALRPADWFTFRTAAFQGNVFAQNVNRHGFRWRLDAETGFTFLNEAEFRWFQSDGARGLPGVFKAGAWFQTGESADPLANSTSSGNYGLYGIIDQMLWREAPPASTPPDGKSTAKSFKSPVVATPTDEGLGWFTRVAFTPPDRNAVSFYFDTGLTYKGLIPTRNNDTIGIGFAYAQLSGGARSTLSDDGITPAGAEMVIEFTYQAQLTDFLYVQPDLQYVINPGASSDPGNALVIGCRASVIF